MKPPLPIPEVDLFAGPGGLGEGFSRVEDDKAFRTIISINKDAPRPRHLG